MTGPGDIRGVAMTPETVLRRLLAMFPAEGERELLRLYHVASLAGPRVPKRTDAELRPILRRIRREGGRHGG